MALLLPLISSLVDELGVAVDSLFVSVILPSGFRETGFGSGLDEPLLNVLDPLEPLVRLC